MKLLRILSLCLVMACVPAWAKNRKCDNYACGTGASCKKYKCQCPKSGEGNFFCHDDHSAVCYLLNPPHLIEEQSEERVFTVPCRHRITETELETKCSVEIDGVVELKQLKFAYEVAIYVYIKYDGHLGIITLDSEKEQYFFINKGKKTVLSRETKVSVIVGCKKITIYCDGIRWIVESPECGFRVHFTPPTGDGSASKQIDLPGVAVIIDRQDCSKIAYKDNGYPDTHCSVYTNPGAMQDYRKKNKFQTMQKAIIGAWLITRIEQGALSQCSDLINKFHEKCKTGEQKTKAVNICAEMFKKDQRGCFNKRDKIVPLMEICVEAVCSNSCVSRCTLADLLKKEGCELPELGDNCSTMSFDKLLI